MVRREGKKESRRFPNKILKCVRESDNNPVICNDYFNWSWEDIKESNKILYRKRGKFVLFPNFKGTMVIKGMERESKDQLMIFGKSKKSDSYYFVDNEINRKVDVDPLVTLKFYPYVGMVDGIFCKIYSNMNLESGVPYNIKAVKYSVIKGKLGESAVDDKYIVLSANVNEEDFSYVKKLKFNSIHDLALMWNYKKDHYVYTEIETALILCNAFYMESSIPALNLVLCGETEAKKSAWIILLSRIFGDPEYNSASLTDKGLVPSFFSDKPKLGAMLSSNYITLLDDLFRYYDQQAIKHRMNKFEVLRVGLGQIFNILDRTTKKYDSGKGDLTAKYNASFFATDNMKYKNSIRRVWKEDKALLRRFSFLLTCPGTEERGEKAGMETEEAIKCWNKRMAKIGLDMNTYKLFGLYMRKEMKKVKIDDVIIDHLEERLIQKYQKSLHFRTKIRGIMKFNVVLSRHIPNWNSKKMTEEMIDRLGSDFYEIAIKSI